MRVSRGLKAFSIYKVGKDRDVVLIDLQVAGVENISPTSKYRPYFAILENTVRENGLDVNGLVHEDYVCRYKRLPENPEAKSKSALLLIRLFSDKRGVVRYVAISAFRSGAFSALDMFLQRAGWKRIFHVEIALKRARVSSV